MGGDDLLARAVALLIVGLFVVAQAISYFDADHPVPAEMYPLVTVAVGYLLGLRLMSNDKGKK